MSTFPTLLKHYRERAGLSQSKLGERTGADHSYVSRLESKQRDPSREMVMRLADALTLDEHDRNELLRAAGYRGNARSTDEALETIPELRDLAEMLIDERVSVSYRGSVRMLISACVQQAAMIKEQAA